MPGISRERHAAVAAVVAAVFSLAVGAQQIAEPRTLLPAALLKAIADEVSGAQALAHVLEIVPYERDRPASEYGDGTYREAAYMAAAARDYGFQDVQIERFPMSEPEWDGEMAELWIDAPVRKLVTRYRDLTATLAPGSKSADVTTELVFVGRGDRESDYAGTDVRGKIVLGSGPVGALHNLAVRRFGAAGVASFYNGNGMPIDRPDQIAWAGLTPIPRDAAAQGLQSITAFGFVLSHRMGMELLDLVESHPRVVAHAKVKAAEHAAQHQVVVATIPGDGSIDASRKPELVFSAHLFEGIAKQSANDNAAGPAVQLEFGRAWIQLVKAGALPPPKRTVRFLWVPEFSGTRAYIARHPEFVPRALATINMDMVGADQAASMNSLHLSTSPYSLPTYLNDVATLFMEYVGETNRDQKSYARRAGFGLFMPIVDPKGSRDPFWYHVDKFFGGSDHVVFIESQPRVPAVGFNTYHDFSYHTSDDTPRAVDPTQMKRAAFIGLAMGQVLANATAAEALAIAGLTAGFGQQRLGGDLRRATTAISQAATADELTTAYKEALVLMRWARWRERGNVHSVATLIGQDSRALAHLASLEDAVAEGAALDTRQVQAVYLGRCAALGVDAMLEPAITNEERSASRLVPRAKPAAAGAFPPNGGGGGGVPAVLGSAYDMEARFFADGSRSVLDIRDAISAEFGPVPLDRVLSFFRTLEKDGSWTIESRSER
jgi:aminopeptidase YwaD